MKRAVLIVLDSFGVGAMPDAKSFGDDNPNTAANILKACGGLDLPNMYSMGLSFIDGVGLLPFNGKVKGAFAKLAEKSKGKDTITGHWELMGLVSESGFSIYSNGFPGDFIKKLENAWQTESIGNIPASGTEIIQRFGQEHIKTGKPIVYTSADSVLQIAAHEDIISVSQLYEMCETARRIADSCDMGIGRIIARPFTGNQACGFTRTENRHDYSLPPFADTVLDRLCRVGKRTLAIGKINDIFSGRGITCGERTKNNEEGINATAKHMQLCDYDFIFTNLVDFDMSYGHRRDAQGYRKALEYFDSRLTQILNLMTDDYLIMITADHGCDPTAEGTDHTREYVPLIMKTNKTNEAINLGTIKGFEFVGETVYNWIVNEKLPF